MAKQKTAKTEGVVTSDQLAEGAEVEETAPPPPASTPNPEGNDPAAALVEAEVEGKKELMVQAGGALAKPVLVDLKQEVVINGQHFGPGKAYVPDDAYDVWKNAL